MCLCHIYDVGPCVPTVIPFFWLWNCNNVGEGRLVGVPVVVGLLAGVALQRMLAAKKNVDAHMPAAATAGL